MVLQVTVALCDSGVDSTHPDLAYAGGQTWVVEPSNKRPGDMVDAGVDFYGHGMLNKG
jgi:subtilisin family serine protease